MFAAFVVFSHHVDHDGQGDHERCIDSLGNVDRVAIAEQGELATYLRQ